MSDNQQQLLFFALFVIPVGIMVWTIALGFARHAWRELRKGGDAG